MSANALFRPTFADLRAEIERRAAEGAAIDEINALVEQFLSTGGSRDQPHWKATCSTSTAHPIVTV